MKKRVILWGILLLLSASIFLFLMWEDYKSNDIYEQLQEVADVTSILQKEPEVVDDGESNGEQEIADTFWQLYAINHHYIGWLTIEGTAIDYPVMQNREVKDYYLHRDFYGDYSSYGVPYLDESCEIGDSNNLIIYGHAMKNGTMFADLLKYASYEYYQEHSKVTYFDAEGIYEYVIFAAFPIDLLEDDFAYTSYSNMSQQEFTYYLNQIKNRECYSTNIIPEYGEQVMTFSTCDSSYEEGRFIVVAVRRD